MPATTVDYAILGAIIILGQKALDLGMMAFKNRTNGNGNYSRMVEKIKYETNVEILLKAANEKLDKVVKNTSRTPHVESAMKEMNEKIAGCEESLQRMAQNE